MDINATVVVDRIGSRQPRDPVLALRAVSTEFTTPDGLLPAVRDVSLALERGKVLAIIGESGSGKSALLRTILGVHTPNATETGEIVLDGRDLLSMSAKDRARTRGRQISMVFQDPLTALDPVHTVEKQLCEPLQRHLGLSKRAARARALDLLELVHIPSPAQRLKAYPFEMSGGMRQRVVIAMALSCTPSVLLADEPTTALDVTVQARILDLVRDLQRERDMGVLFVTHDLAVAAQIADEVAVMYAGRLVEHGSVEDVLLHPAHPYTQGLLEANVRPHQQHRPRSIVGAPPSLLRLPPGCSFAPRCDLATVGCWERRPEVIELGEGRWSRCTETHRLLDEVGHIGRHTASAERRVVSA